MPSGVALPDDLVAWIEDVAGGRVTNADRRPGGARKEAWFVDVSGPDHTVHELFLRYDRADPAANADPWTLHREATVYLALQHTDVPVPRVLGVHPAHQAMLSVRLAGENWFSRIADEQGRERIARDFITKLAALHRLRPADLDLPAFPAPTTVADAVRHELDELDGILEQRGGPVDPALVFTLDWLRRNIPPYDGPVVLVQGDTGPGNFMYDREHVVAIVDWELAHLGDPMDDIAWLSLRATQEPLPDFPERLREYEALSGFAIDESRVRYYQVMAEAKLQVMVHRGPRTGTGEGGGERGDRDSDGGGGADIGNRFIYGVLHRRLWFEALAAAVGLDLTPAEIAPTTAPGEHDWLYRAVLDQLREVIVPRISDPLALVRAKGTARIVKYLEQVSARGAFYDACELDDLAELLGERPQSKAAGREAAALAARAGELTDRQYLGYLWRRVARETELARPAMGALADRHWPEPAEDTQMADTEDLDAIAAGRRYPTFTPADDDFHDEVLSDRWWESETNWFSWNVPERRMGGWTYGQARPNANICNGGVWVWDDTASFSWELPYHQHYSGLRLGERGERDMRDFEWPTGVHIKVLEPLTKYTIDYDDAPDLEVHLVFDAIMAPNPHPIGVAPFFKGTHLDQPGHVTGEMVLRGERIPVDCYSVRDRSWGPRPAGRRKKRPADATEVRTGAGGIGYSFGTAGPSDAWLTYSLPGVDTDPLSCGFLLRDGKYAHILRGERRVEVDAGTGWITRIAIEAVDDAGRTLAVVGDAVSRHWRGHGGDTLLRWQWDGREGWGEDQSYFSRAVADAYKARAASSAVSG